MAAHSFEGFEPGEIGPIAVCTCGARRERANERKARDAIEIHVVGESLAEGRRRALDGEG